MSDREIDLSFQNSLSDRHILVVDDDNDSLALLEHVLRASGAEVTAVASAAEAFGLLERERFDVLVSDIGMPGTDGYALMRGVRALRPPASEIPAVALTAYTRAEDRIAALKAGFQMHVAKPIEVAELLTVLTSLTRRPGTG